VIGIEGQDTLSFAEAGENDGLGALIDNVKLVVDTSSLCYDLIV
jgi:hypothetical protein